MAQAWLAGAVGPVEVADGEAVPEVAEADEVSDTEEVDDMDEVDESPDAPADEDAVPDGDALHAVNAAQTASVEPNQETAEPAIGSLSRQTIQQTISTVPAAHGTAGEVARGWLVRRQRPCSSSTTGASRVALSAPAQT